MKIISRKISRLFKNFSVAMSIIFIWRGLWILLDMLDVYLFGGSHAITALGGIIIGLVILYLPDHNLDELGKL